MRPVVSVVLHPSSLAIGSGTRLRPRCRGTQAGRAGPAFIIVLVLAAVVSLFACSGEQRHLGTVEAFVTAQEFAKDRIDLFSPGSAKWPYYLGDDATCRSLGNDRFEVSSYVDSQNVFGALIRTHYRCTLRYDGNGKWALEQFALGKQASREEEEAKRIQEVRRESDALEEGDIAELRENEFSQKAWLKNPWAGISIEVAERFNFADEATAERLVQEEQIVRLDAGTPVILLRQDGSGKGFYKWVSVASEGPLLGRTLAVGSGHLTELRGQAAMLVREKIMERARAGK